MEFFYLIPTSIWYALSQEPAGMHGGYAGQMTSILPSVESAIRSRIQGKVLLGLETEKPKTSCAWKSAPPGPHPDRGW